jgi:SWI/SNF-related matrix-associated actin-dependent regulator of chromatin subfamily A member 5
LPEGEVEGIGPSLLEFEVLGYGENKQAYYIRCPDCVGIFKAPKDEEERIWVKGWEEEFAAVEKQGEMEVEKVEAKDLQGEKTARKVVKSSGYEMVDLTADSPVKMEISRSTATTVTTQPEEFETNDSYAVVRGLHVGREVIIID